jgi:hypothetical protein
MAVVLAQSALHSTLSPNVVTQALLSGEQGQLTVYNRSGVADIYVRLDRTDPTVGGDGSHFVGPNQSRTFGVSPADMYVALISSGAAPFSIEAG